MGVTLIEGFITKGYHSGYIERMKASILAIALALAALLPACASRPSSSEVEWQRGQCNQINDREAREKCLKRVDAGY
jgi:hypothetical protein